MVRDSSTMLYTFVKIMLQPFSSMATRYLFDSCTLQQSHLNLAIFGKTQTYPFLKLINMVDQMFIP